MQTRIRIIGSGISGLFTAYYLRKYLDKKIDIEIYASQDKLASNASTNSLAWLNALYPSKDKMTKQGYDQYRIESIHTWNTLIDMLRADGITDIVSTQHKSIKIQEHEINSLYVFFNPEQENQHICSHKRLEHYADNLQTNQINKAELANHFPFVIYQCSAHLP